MADASRSRSRRLVPTSAKAYGIYLAVIALVVAGLGWVILDGLRELNVKDPKTFEDIPAFARTFLGQPMWYAGLLIPGFLFGVLTFALHRGRALWFTLTVLCMVTALAVLVLCVVATLAPFYQIEPV